MPILFEGNEVILVTDIILISDYIILLSDISDFRTKKIT